MASHLSKDTPKDDSKDQWLEDDDHLFLQICNFTDGKVLTLINHCEYVMELMEYLKFVYSGKGNVSQIFDMCSVTPPTWHPVSSEGVIFFFL